MLVPCWKRRGLVQWLPLWSLLAERRSRTVDRTYITGSAFDCTIQDIRFTAVNHDPFSSDPSDTPLGSFANGQR
ncbi:hypothetical protein HBH71_139810 [Parastagonospora nodorum]|nr:hypothetical protein HBH95_113860 [Parastagonospora nodorum]KAH5115133.1 hypothetical protein HBH71_139810 [Parastagonospora nodorum]